MRRMPYSEVFPTVEWRKVSPFRKSSYGVIDLTGPEMRILGTTNAWAGDQYRSGESAARWEATDDPSSLSGSADSVAEVRGNRTFSTLDGSVSYRKSDSLHMLGTQHLQIGGT